MFNTENAIVVPYTREQMFNLVNDISAYSDFIPGCVYSCVLISNDYELTAKIDVFKFGINQSFITRNFMIKNKSIMIHLIDGPFKSLFGSWTFISLTEKMTKIECFFCYEFHQKYLEKIFNFIVKEVVDDVIQSFIVRANIIYKCSDRFYY
ncbi:ubiquinone-binding protein [Blochmannia endosymbiont of Polyrhachis (Hedomyrma) turneri]|uniref:ubiquinone-binding protein n=1 Tax=Blochmannia endosymbiont of Polyrhachis (Hedomyrma) turneri TaxID=1505596 RepID=UPI00061A64F9|nr:ubiquinone-binding protein [Blochmannia endosymbiont of Polyrhachis (Hedomyrma) turneri]AKC60107.1 Ribosome association toxin RatA [Blochmannia endosymbiont of Polyrhachis (Hedomyrma) turneri]